MNRSAFVKMNEFHTLFLLLEDGIPVDFRTSRRANLEEFVFHISFFMEKLSIPPDRVYCEGRGWATPIKDWLKRRGISIADIQGSEALRDADFEASQAYHIHHLRECAKALVKIEREAEYRRLT